MREESKLSCIEELVLDQKDVTKGKRKEELKTLDINHDFLTHPWLRRFSKMSKLRRLKIPDSKTLEINVLFMKVLAQMPCYAKLLK